MGTQIRYSTLPEKLRVGLLKGGYITINIMQLPRFPHSFQVIIATYNYL